MSEEQISHTDWKYTVKVSNDNTKGEKRVTVTVRDDVGIEPLVKLAIEQYAKVLAG